MLHRIDESESEFASLVFTLNLTLVSQFLSQKRSDLLKKGFYFESDSGFSIFLSKT